MITVLIVDDSASLRQILLELLEKRGINVLEAASGMEAQEVIQKQIPDLVITDLIMPQMNGYELCRWN